MMQEGKIFSSELLANIHIKLDKEGLEGISEKELMVLLDDRAARRLYETSTEIIGELRQTRKELKEEIGGLREEIGSLRTELKEEMGSLREEIGSFRTGAIRIGWYILGTLITIALGIIANLIVALIVK
ncbi:hypothetical protein FJZ31_43655 [Candidatus Poribacteria bacterium]|nr:hypothetical protein [Candidatus Poribacteria bacterium]